jgi:hypothetical protein
MEIYVDLTKTISLNSHYVGYSIEEYIAANPETDNVHINVVHSGPDNGLIEIERLEEMLNKVKETGATHVEIDFHIDHEEYEIGGYTITHSDEQELLEQRAMEDFENDKISRIMQLQQEIIKIKNEKYGDIGNPVNCEDDDLPF